MTCEHVIEEIFLKWNSDIRAYPEIGLDAQRSNSIARDLRNIVVNFDAVNFETQVMKQRDIPSIAKAEVENSAACVLTAVELEARISSQKGAHHKFNGVQMLDILIRVTFRIAGLDICHRDSNCNCIAELFSQRFMVDIPDHCVTSPS